ncbi:hypothetical protein [Streptomyces longisporoflavus]|uniref:UL36 very large tegument protein n=1 Tax=Streptomyces longisporoflavus TaxID=28044 RepID=A0ABW7QVA6_9ACTN
MATGQLPDQVREFAKYLKILLAQLDPGAGWCGVFWSRDPEGMQACLDGAEVPPWDVVEALLHDLAAGYGTQAAERETGLARELHSASLNAYDARPGGRELLGERLDMMLTEQRFAVERQAELARSLETAATPDEAERLNRDLAWVRDDHERATARCAELRQRIERLDRADQPQWVDFGTPVSDDFAGEEADRFEGRTDGGAEGQVPVGFGGGLVGGAGVEAFDGSGGVGDTGGFGGSAALDAGAPTTAFGARAAAGSGAPAGQLELDGTAPEPGLRAPEFGDFAADGSASPPDSRTLSVDADTHAHAHPVADSDSGIDSGIDSADFDSFDSRDAAGFGSAPVPDPGAPPARAPKQGRKARDTSRRPRRLRGARFAGSSGSDDGVAAGGGVAPPEPPPQPPATVGRDLVPPGREADRATADVVAALIKLRGEGRSGEAHGVLVEAAGWPAARLPALAGELHRAGLGADWSTLLWEAASLPPEPLVALADALAGAGRAEDCRKLLRQGVSRPASEIAEAVLALLDAGREREARALLDAYLRVRTAEDAAGCAHSDPYRLIPLLLETARGVSEECHWDLVHALRVAGFSA